MKLIDRIRAVGMRRHLADSTIRCYQGWVRDFLRFHRQGERWRTPAELAEHEVGEYLTWLAAKRRLSASTQNQATNALVFLYKHVLAEELPTDHLGRFAAERSRRPIRMPTVLSQAEVRRLFENITEPRTRLIVELLYGTGLRVNECCTLRIRDIDFDRSQIVVRQGKGDKDRLVMLPRVLAERLQTQVQEVRQRHEHDLRIGAGYVPVPPAVRHKIPQAARDWRWQFLFPSSVIRRDAQDQGTRWHADPATLSRFISSAAKRSDIAKRVTAHTLRHSFATHLLEAGNDVRQVQALMGHNSLETTKIYLHLMTKPEQAVKSPLDRLVGA